MLLFASHLYGQNLNLDFRAKMPLDSQSVANIGGYAAGGREYALVCAGKGLAIVDVTDPDQPQLLVQVPGYSPREVKTYQHYAYAVSYSNGGVQIIDLSGLPDTAALNYRHYLGDGAIDSLLTSCHTLHIDTTKGYLYTYGCNLFSGGAVVFDLNPDPYHPVFVGKFDTYGYIHDGYVDNDTLYAAHVYNGYFSVVDMGDKSSPIPLGIQYSPGFVTHNTWLSDDRKFVLTTDEVSGGQLAAFDVSDPTDIRLTDKIRTLAPGSNPTVHNTHIRGNFAVTAWYTAGVTIVDVSDPENLVEVGRYDIAPHTDGQGWDGCFGVYPYLPSGNLVASSMSSSEGGSGGELWVLTPQYVQACFVAGTVTNAETGVPVPGASVSIQGNSSATNTQSGANGGYKTGQLTSGSFHISVSKPGFQTALVPVMLVNGETAALDIALTPAASYNISGQVRYMETNLPAPFARVAAVAGNGLAFETEADSTGQFFLPGVTQGVYDLVAGAWGYDYAVKSGLLLASDQEHDFLLPRGYRDDFVFDYGWETGGTSATGMWERAIPIAVVFTGGLLTPGADLFGTDVGPFCFVTGNHPNPGEDAVQNGSAVLRSPVMDLSGYEAPVLKGFVYYAALPVSETPPDALNVWVENGGQEALIASFEPDDGWKPINKTLSDYVPLTSAMRIRIECSEQPDSPIPFSYEALFDHFRIVEGALTATQEALPAAKLAARANPFREQTLVEYALPGGGGGRLAWYDLFGRLQETAVVEGQAGVIAMGRDRTPGIYVVRLEQDGKAGPALRLVRLR